MENRDRAQKSRIRQLENQLSMMREQLDNERARTHQASERFIVSETSRRLSTSSFGLSGDAGGVAATTILHPQTDRLDYVFAKLVFHDFILRLQRIAFVPYSAKSFLEALTWLAYDRKAAATNCKIFAIPFVRARKSKAGKKMRQIVSRYFPRDLPTLLPLRPPPPQCITCFLFFAYDLISRVTSSNIIYRFLQDENDLFIHLYSCFSKFKIFWCLKMHLDTWLNLNVSQGGAEGGADIGSVLNYMCVMRRKAVQPVMKILFFVFYFH